MSVTYSRKRYIIVCPGCDQIHPTDRKDTMTCSPTCRVKAHRNGNLKRLRKLADDPYLKIEPATILHTNAVVMLRPELEAEIRDGRMTLDEAMAEALNTFDDLLRDILSRGAA